MNYIGAIYVIGAILLKKIDHIKYALTISGTGCFFDLFRMIFRSSNSSWAYIRFIEFIVRFLAFLFEVVWIAGVYCYFKQEEAIRAIKSSKDTGIEKKDGKTSPSQPSTSADPAPAATTAAPKPPEKNTPVVEKPNSSGVKFSKETTPKALGEKPKTVQKISRETPEADRNNKSEASSANKSKSTKSLPKVEQEPVKLTDKKPYAIPKVGEQSVSAKMPNDQNADEFSADVDEAEEPPVILPTVNKSPEKKTSTNDQKTDELQVKQESSKTTDENQDKVSNAEKKSKTLPASEKTPTKTASLPKENISSEETTKPGLRPVKSANALVGETKPSTNDEKKSEQPPTSEESPTEQKTDESPADNDVVERKSAKPPTNDKEPEKKSNTLPASGKTPTKTASLPKEKVSSKETTKLNVKPFKSASALVGETKPTTSDGKKSERPPTREKSPTEQKTDESPADNDVVERKSAKPPTNDKEPEKKSKTLPASGKTPTKTASLPKEKVSSKETTKPNVKPFKSASALVGEIKPSTSDGKKSEQPLTRGKSPTDQKTDESPADNDVVEQKSVKPQVDREPFKTTGENRDKVSSDDGKTAEQPPMNEESPTEQKTDDSPADDDVVKPK